MKLSPYAQDGARYLEKGYAAITGIPGEKVPGEMRKGRWQPMFGWQDKYRTRSPSRYELMLWNVWPDANVCVVMGEASGGAVALDLDTDDPAISGAILGAAPLSFIRKRGAKGLTAFYHAGESIKSKSWRIGGKVVCDLIASGRQTVVPPSRHPSGCQYVWLGPPLWQFYPNQLVSITREHIAAIDAALTPLGYEPEPERTEPTAVYNGGPIDFFGNVHRQLNDAALDNLDAWIPLLGLYRVRKRPQGYEAVATWRGSNGGNPIEKRKLNLKIARNGIVDFGDGTRPYTPLDLVAAALGVGRDQAFAWLWDTLGWDSDVIILKPRTLKNEVRR